VKLQVERTWSRSCPMADFVISSVDPPDCYLLIGRLLCVLPDFTFIITLCIDICKSKEQFLFPLLIICLISPNVGLHM
jgi:hypothetical protein